jgi:hypothetical protein
MKLKFLLFLVFSLSTGLTFSFINNKNVAIENFRFNLNLYDREKEAEAIKSAIKQYNKNSASFYNSAGFLAGLEEIPAAPLIKRRLFKDINMLKRDGLVMVFDKDAVEMKRIIFLNSALAVAETEEVWAISLQEIDTRKPLFNIKASEVKVRYLFHKEPFLTEKKEWIAHEVDVYPDNEDFPELDIKPVL